MSSRSSRRASCLDALLIQANHMQRVLTCIDANRAGNCDVCLAAPCCRRWLTRWTTCKCRSRARRRLCYSHVSGTPEFGRRLCLMSSDRVIIDAIKTAQRLLWQNLPPTHGLPDASTVMRFRDLVRSPAVQSALERSTIRIHVRAAERVLANQSRADREIFSRLWDVFDDPHLNQALGFHRIAA